MIDHTSALQALRDRALALSVVSITDTISATATGYARASGSFLDDKVEVGQEIVGTSFSNSQNNNAKLVTDVDALTITTRGFVTDAQGNRELAAVGVSGTVVEGAATRTLDVGLPADAELVNGSLRPGAGVPWWREEYDPGPQTRIGVGPLADVEVLVDYFITLFLPSGIGSRAARRYADEILNHFAPGLSLSVPNSSFRVRGDVAPFPGKFVQSADPVAGYLVVPVTVPLILRTANAI